MDFTSTLGMEFVGFILAIWLFGINTVQAYRYFQTYNDRLFLKLIVAADIIADVANTILTSWGLYIQFVVNFGQAFDLNPPLVAETIATFINIFIVQCFLAQSIFRVSNRNKSLTVFIIILSIIELVVGLGAVTDLVITISLVIYLSRGNVNVSYPTSSILDRVITFIVQRGLLIMVNQVSLAVLYISMPGNWAWAIFQFGLSKVYTSTFLAMLNRREQLREMAANMDADHGQDMPEFLVSSVAGSSREPVDHGVMNMIMVDRGQMSEI
ncbi:hypothetical protein F5I97DRAFT_1887830 [Phlebopus sp. FC_14]|nr:hypothetical protein F5I97DRAFT_1887830 [Phlebopus sp. FC_14]